MFVYRHYLFLFLLYFGFNELSAQIVHLDANIKSSFFQGKEDSLALSLSNQIIERYNAGMKLNNQPINPITLNPNKSSKYTYKVLVSDTIYEDDKIHKVEMIFYEQDIQKGILQQNILTNPSKEALFEEILRWASVDLSVYGNVSHTINTKAQNIETGHDSLKIRNIIVLFEAEKSIKKDDFNTFKAIIYNKYNNCQEAIHVHHKGKNKHCNLYFYDTKIPKNEIDNPVVVTYNISVKGDKYEFTQITKGQYEKKISEDYKKMIIDIKEFKKYPIMHMRMLSGSAYPLMQEVLELE